MTTKTTTDTLATIAARINASTALASTCVVERRGARLIVDTSHPPTQRAIAAIIERVGGAHVDTTAPGRMVVTKATPQQSADAFADALRLCTGSVSVTVNDGPVTGTSPKGGRS
jgi:hypothetical protein